MPFIFHSKKESIFDTKIESSPSKEIQSFQTKQIQAHKEFIPNETKTSLCKDHPFRKLNQQNESISLASSSQSCLNKNILRFSKNLKKPMTKSFKFDAIETHDKQISDGLIIGQQKLNLISGELTQIVKIHQSKQKCNDTNKKIKKQQILRHIRQKSNQNQERLKYFVNDTPGPGTYTTPSDNKQKSTVFYQNSTINHPLPSKVEKNLQCSLVSKQKKTPQIEERSFLFDCNYKNQKSPSFRSSILNKPTLRKNGALLSILFANNQKKNKENQSETTCESRMSQIGTLRCFQQEYIKQENNLPSPFSYDPKLDFLTSKNYKKSKVFISGTPKFVNYINQSNGHGLSPGSYNDSILQNRQVFNLNQIKKPNKFKQYDEEIQPCAFFSKVPRQLHFDTQQLGKQQLYYSPKNNLTDLASINYNKASKSSKCYFGSSLQRFEKDKISDMDPYKYCYSKLKLVKNEANCPSLTFKEKRQIFNQIPNNISPNKYQDNTKTISKQTEKQIFRKLLQSKYQDQILLIKEKKNNMQKALIEQKNKCVDIKTTQRISEEINPDNYQKFLINKKRLQKQSISFGYNKKSPLKRAFQAKKELDIYYDTQPAWDIKSFNKSYGYQVGEN